MSRKYGWLLPILLGLLGLLPWLFYSDPRSRLLVLGSIYLSLGTCLVSLPLGTFLAILLIRVEFPGQRFACLLLGAMLFIPLYIQAAAWKAGFAQQGWFSNITAPWGIAPLLNGWPGAIWIHSLAAIPWVVLIVGGGLYLVEPELEEEALLDASPIKVLFHVTLRRAGMAIGVAALWVVVSTAGEMTVTDLWTLRTYAEEVYTGFALGDSLQEAQLKILPGVSIIFWLILTAFVLCRGLTSEGPYRSSHHLKPFSVGRLRRPTTMIVYSSLFLLLGVPLISLGYKAGSEVYFLDGQFTRSWSIVKLFTNVLSCPLKYADSFFWSLLLGILSATTVLVSAVLLGWPACRGGLSKLPAILTTAVCLAVPGPIIGISLIWLLNRRESELLCYLYDRTLLAPWLAVSIRSLPVTVLIVWHALRNVSSESLQSAATEGAGSLRKLRSIALPQCRSTLAAAWMIALAISMGDLAASSLVLPPGVDPLSRRIFGMVHAVVDDQLAGICLAVIGMFMVIAILVMWFLGIWQKKARDSFDLF